MFNVKELTKRKMKQLSYLLDSSRNNNEAVLLAIGKLLSNQQYLMDSTNINDFEFKIFSQFGDDGIIQYLVKNLSIKNKIFIEFGVGSYEEANTRFLMANNNWRGLVLDCSAKSINSLKNKRWYWKYDLTCEAVFITKDNINDLLKRKGFSNIGLLSIDIDGNDYHIFNKIDVANLNPSIIIIEYNSLFGIERCISVPYDKNFVRTKAHYSGLFAGASLPALCYAAKKKGYSLVGCNLAGNNAFFVRKDLLNIKVKEVSIEVAYKKRKFREARDCNGALAFLREREELEMIRGLEVINVKNNNIEKL